MSRSMAALHVVVRQTPDQDPALPAPVRVKAQRAAARAALGEAAALSGCPDTVFEKRSERGAPIPTTSGWHWSISHDATLVAATVWEDAPIGVDVEKIALRRRLLIERVADAAERQILGESPDTQLDALGFARLWTAKEAVLKAERIGLPGLERCRVDETAGPFRTHLTYDRAPRTCLHTQADQHLVSACALGQRVPRIVWHLPPTSPR